KEWLARMLILRPIPSLILGGSDSKDETLQPNAPVTNFGGWFSGLLAYAPSAYTMIDDYLKLQGRFKHLKPEAIKLLQDEVDRRYARLLKKFENQ
ncbi:MAG: hypothetical protein ABSA30_11765, partial [Candidatus Aminicenantales bacterium]